MVEADGARQLGERPPPVSSRQRGPNLSQWGHPMALAKTESILSVAEFGTRRAPRLGEGDIIAL
jgi:hypothetical protein